MKIELINRVTKPTALEQVLYNRGITNISKYLNTSDADINSPLLFGELKLNEGLRMLIQAINQNKKTLIVVDADCDGFTSSALLINYLNNVFPAFVNNCVDWFIHSGKQHGLSDCIDYAKTFDFVILPDSSSNDYEYHKVLKDKNIDILILDHHEAEKISEYACVINNQLSDYPNKELSGVGVTWQFCRYIDMKLKTSYADNYLDLVALGLTADMMSLKSLETKEIINRGFKREVIKNPFISAMIEKNEFSLNKGDYKPTDDLLVTPMGAAFYIAPFVNAMVRSGTQEEKELLFKSMLTMEAFKEIPSTKRGHSIGEMETLVEQAIRTCTNVKNRQTRTQDAGLEFLEQMIEERHLLDHKVLLFLLEPGQVDRNIAGLIANKFMAKYQRPCCILTKVVEEIKTQVDYEIDENGEKVELPWLVDGPSKYKISYQGSARGCDISGVTNFKDICESAPCVTYAQGHQGAFGLGISLGTYDTAQEEFNETFGEEIYQFIDYTDKALESISSEPIYYVDYLFSELDVDGQIILDIANMNNYWGKDIDRAYVGIKNVHINKDNFKVMKSNTLKITLPNGIDIIKFGGTEEEIEQFSTEGYVTVNMVCKCCANEWNYNVNPQLQLENYEIVDKGGWLF